MGVKFKNLCKDMCVKSQLLWYHLRFHTCSVKCPIETSPAVQYLQCENVTVLMISPPEEVFAGRTQLHVFLLRLYKTLRGRQFKGRQDLQCLFHSRQGVLIGKTQDPHCPTPESIGRPATFVTKEIISAQRLCQKSFPPRWGEYKTTIFFCIFCRPFQGCRGGVSAD